MYNKLKHSFAIVSISFCFCCAAAAHAAVAMAVFPGETVPLPMPAMADLAQKNLHCQVSKFYDTAVQIMVHNLKDPNQILQANINGNALRENQGHLTRRENLLVFAKGQDLSL